MYRGLVESLVVIVLAALGIADTWRLSNLVRAGGTYHDVIGPDRYLGAISIGLLIGGIWHLRVSLKSKGQAPGKHEEGSQITLVVLVVFVLMVYTFALPTLGYLFSTLIFFPIVFFIFRVRPWSKSVVIGLITAALFYAIFGYFAEVPLPRGLLGFAF